MLCLSRKHNNIFSLPSIFAGEFFVLVKTEKILVLLAGSRSEH